MDTSTQGYSGDIQGRLKLLLDKHSHTVYRMAKNAEVGYATIQGLVKGTRKNPELETLEKIATAYNVTVAWLTGSVTLRPNDLAVEPNLASAELTLPRFQVRGEGTVGAVRERAVAGDEYSADVVPGISWEEAERLLALIVNPSMLRRQAGEPNSDDVIVSAKAILFAQQWPSAQKKAVDALINRIERDAKGER